MALTTNDLTISFGDRLRKARRLTGMSQEELAAALGIKTGRLSAWETGDSSPRGGELTRFATAAAKVFNEPLITAEWLLGLVTVGELLCELHAEPGCPLCSPAELAMTYSPAMSRAS